jgi:PAS domain S-box-containing protein
MTAPSSSPVPNSPLRLLGGERLTVAVMAVLAPVLALIAFGGSVVQEKLEDYRETADMVATAHLARSGHAVIRELQEERGLSALYVGCGRTRWLAEVDEQRTQTDSSLDNFRHTINTPQVHTLMLHNQTDPGLGEVDVLRGQVDGDGDISTLSEGYDRLTTTIAASSVPTRGPEQASIISAYMDLDVVKDRITRQRSIVATALIEGRPLRDYQAALQTVQAEARAFTQSFHAHATPHQAEIFDSIVHGPSVAEVERLSAKAIAGKLTRADADSWYAAHTALSKLINSAENALAADVEHDIGKRLEAAKLTFYAVLAVVLALVVFAVETLRRSEQRAAMAEQLARKLLRAVEQNPISVMITDTDGVIEYVNPAFTTMTGYGRTEALGQTPEQLHSDDTAHEAYSQLRRTIDSGVGWSGELRNRRRDGSLYWEHMSVAPVRGLAGEVVNYIALKEDVTEVKVLRGALEREHANVRRILETLHDGIALVGPDYRFQYTNPALSGQFGEIGERDSTGYFGADCPTCAPQVIEHHEALRQEWHSQGTDRTYEVAATPVQNSDGSTSVLQVFHDITARKQAEEALEAAREAAEIANRAKSEFLAAMSHELRTPLNAIIGFSEIMAEQLLGPLGQDVYAEYAGDINRSGRHLLQLINDILDIARIEVGRVDLHEEMMDLESALSAAFAMVHDRAEHEGLVLTSTLPADLPRLWADSRCVKQVLVNLLGNAVKFTGKGGSVTIGGAVTPTGDLEIAVIDTGIGIAPEDMGKVMAPFGQADSGMARRYDGSGLGLPLSRKFMDLHGGSLRIDSVVGKGTTVTLVFPKDRLYTGQMAG